MKTIKEFWRSLRRHISAKREQQRRRTAELESLHALQIREYDNKVYICLDGVPLLTENHLKTDIVSALWEARDNYVSYKLNKLSRE